MRITSALGSRLSALGSRLSALGSRLSALGSRLSALGSRLSALGSRLSALGSRLSALGSRLSALGSRLSALGSRLSALGSRLSALGSRLSALGSRLSALGSRLSALGSRLSLLMGRPVSSRPGPRIRSTGEPPPPSAAVSSARSTAFSPSTRVISSLLPAVPMCCSSPVRSARPQRNPRAARLGAAGSAALTAHSVARPRGNLLNSLGLLFPVWRINPDGWFFDPRQKFIGRVSRRHLRVRGDRLHARAIPASRRRSHCEAMHQERSQGAGSRRLSPRTQPSPCAAGTTAAACPAASRSRVSARSQSRNARAAGFSPDPGAVARK